MKFKCLITFDFTFGKLWFYNFWKMVVTLIMEALSCGIDKSAWKSTIFGHRKLNDAAAKLSFLK